MSNSREIRLFWFKLAFVVTVLGLAHLLALSVVDGKTSIGLAKVSGPRQSHMIIGTSRIAQAVMPSVLEKEIGAPFLNFAIDAATTSYSPTYNRAIEQKLDPHASNGKFILAMDPWCITGFYHPKNGTVMYPEKKTPLGQLQTFNWPLNIEYLIRDYHEGWGSIILTHLRDNSTVTGHRDGWVEVTRNTDEDFVQSRKEKKIAAKKKEIDHAFVSEEKKQALYSLIKKLKAHGKVYLVRLPVDPDYYLLEEEFYPGFQLFVDSLVRDYGVPFLSMQNMTSEVAYNDGHHINKKYAPLISERIAQWIQSTP